MILIPVSVKGKKAYNNGIICKYFYPGEQPNGWIRGQLKRSPEQIAESNAKREETCLNIYGIRNVLCAGGSVHKEDKKSQDKSSYITNYLGEVVKYPDEYYTMTPREKIKLTKQIKYNDQNYNNREKMLETSWSNAGGREEFYKQRQEKITATCQEKWQCDNYVQSEEFRKKYANNRRYRYDNELFDSSWELYLWIYALDNGHTIIHLPKRFEYEYNNKIHYYYPDFEYNGVLIDVKGSHFISDSGELTAVYSGDDSQLIAAKWQCMIDNNVKLFTFDNLKPAIDWVNDKYGKDYIKQFSLKEGGD